MRILVVVVLMMMGCRKSGPEPVSGGRRAAELTVTDPVAAEQGVDGMRFVTPEALKPELPASVPPQVLEVAKLSSIRVLATEADVARHVDADAMKALVRAASYTSLVMIGMNDKPVEVAIRFDFARGKQTARIEVTKGELDPTLRGYLQRDLDGIPSIGVTADLALKMTFTVDQPLRGPAYKVYLPQGGPAPPDPNAKVTLRSTQLLTPEEDIAKRTTVDELVQVIKAVQAHAERTVGTGRKSAELMVQLHFTPGGHTVQIATKGEPDTKLLRALQDAIKAMPSLRTTGDVAFQLYLTVVP